MRKLRVLACIWLAGTLSSPLSAQSVQSSEPGTPIRVTATELLLDLVVRDKHGRQVKSIKPGDIEVYEDGVRQQILSFRSVASHEAERRETASETKKGEAKPAARPLRSVNVVCIVLHNLDPVARTRAIEAIEEFLKSDLQPETYVGIFNLTDQLTVLSPFTNNRKELIQLAQSGFSGRPLDFGRASEAVLTANPTQATIAVAVSGRSATVTQQIAGGEISNAVITSADVSNSRGANILRGDQVRERGDFSNIVGMRETDKIITMINDLGGLPGRKTVLLITTGLITTGDPERFQSILANANRLDVTIHSLDITGLDLTTSAQAGNLNLGRVANVSRTQRASDSDLAAMREKSRQNDNMNDAVRTSNVQASLRALSEGTGGMLIANTNEFRKPFQRIVEDLDVHYELTYRPTSDLYDGHLRKIEVKLARTDLEAESRTGYFAMPDLKGFSGLAPFETLALGALNARPLPHAFDFHSAAFHFQSGGANSQSALAFEIPGRSLAGTPEPDRKMRRFHVALLVLVKDAGGQIVDKYSVDAPYEIPEANVAAVQASNITYTHPVNLPPGHYTVEAAAMDREAGRASTNVFPWESLASHKGIGMSSVMLVGQVEPVTGQADGSDPLVFQGKRMVPIAGTALAPDAKPLVYFTVYPDKANAEKPKLQVEFLSGGQVVGKQTADLPAPDASGTIPMVVMAVMKPGACELRITSMQGSESATESVKYTVAAK